MRNTDCVAMWMLLSVECSEGMNVSRIFISGDYKTFTYITKFNQAVTCKFLELGEGALHPDYFPPVSHKKHSLAIRKAQITANATHNFPPIRTAQLKITLHHYQHAQSLHHGGQHSFYFPMHFGVRFGHLYEFTHKLYLLKLFPHIFMFVL